ncbi:hypothetical protein R6Q57_023607 [Mikania cordata]
MAFQPSYREVVVEFLSTFTYRPGGLPEIVFSMFRQRNEMSLAEFAIISALYSEPETVTPLYTAGITEIDDATLRAWWPLIADDPFAGTKARVSRIRDPLIRYMHRLIATSIAGHGRSREWCTLQDLFYLYCLVTGHTCQLARCLAENFVTYYQQQQRGATYGGAYITIIGRALGHLHHDTLEELSDPVDPIRLDRRTLCDMKIVRDFPGVGLRFSLVRGVIWIHPPYR